MTEAAAPEQPAMKSTLMGRVGLTLLGAWGARLGFLWIGIMIVVAVFAPLIASSHPLVWKMDGSISSPWLQHLTSVDTLLFVSFAVACVMPFLTRLAWSSRIAGWVWITTAVSLSVVSVALIRGCSPSIGWFLLMLATGFVVLACILTPLVVMYAATTPGPLFAGTVTVVGLAMPVVLSFIDVNLVAISAFCLIGAALCYRVEWLARLLAWLWLNLCLFSPNALGPILGRMAEGVPMVWMMLLLFALVLAAIVVGLPLTTQAKRGTKIGVGAVGIGLAALLVVADFQPPANVVLSQYREATSAGDVQWQVLSPLAYSPGDYQRDRLSLDGVDPRLLKPSLAHPLGTDEGGADVLSRMIHATRIALAIGVIATGIAVGIGIFVGGLMGYFAGWVDLLGMRLVEVFSAIPVIFLLIMIVAFYGRNLYLMMFIIGLTGWVGYAIFIRAEFLKMRSMDYVAAAKACGVPLGSILFKHMLPNGVTPVLVLASFGIASAILIESTLSFIGLGLVEEPSWGQLLNQSRRASGQWGLLIFPGMAIFLTVLAYNLVGEALRDALDPRLQKAEKA